MKNKKLLVLVLAAFSASAIGAVGAVAGCTPHEHSYTWHSNAETHWEECDCGDKQGEPANHVDVKNNTTEADGKDGKCDVCDYEIKQVVSFNVGDHGTAPASQEVSYGAKATKPADPLAEGWKIAGWYKDADLETEFDFDTEVINDNTVLYAKWVEDDTPGSSAKYPHDIELNAQNLKPLSVWGYSYYKFTAPADGRYSISLGLSANSKKCYFTTSLDENGEAYGNGQTSSFKNFDLASGDSITIKLSCAETLPADATVSIIVSEATGGDPLPADAYLDGLYFNGYSLLFTLDRSNNQVSLGNNVYPINYLGGTYFDRLTFDVSGSTYTLNHGANNDSYTITYTSDSGKKTSNLKYFSKPETAIGLSEFSGRYEPADDALELITLFNIDENGGGAYTQNGFSNDIMYPAYNETYNYLTFGNFVLMLNTGEGDEVSLTVYGLEGINSPKTYNRVGDYIPTKLPLGDHAEYEGETYKITDNGNSQFLGTGYPDPTLSVTDYDKATNTYTVQAYVEGVDVTYKLKFEGEGNKTIKMYAADGETLLDTLVKFVVEFNDLPTTSTEVTLSTGDFLKCYSHFKATTSGWYSFNCTDTDFEFYYNMDESNPIPTSTYGISKMSFVDGVATVYLEEGAIIGITTLPDDFNGGQLPVTKGVTFTVAPAEAPKGLDQSNPYELNGLGQVQIATLASGNQLFVKFTPPSAGGYLITVSYTAGWTNYQLLYTVNGTTVGSTDGWNWYGGLSYSDHDYKLTVSDTNPVWIIVDGNNYNNVVVSVALDYRAGATEPTFDSTDSTEGDTLTKTASVASGNYLIADTLGSDLVVTSSTEFTATVNGVAAEVINEGGTYTLTIPAGTNIYLNVSSAVTLTMSYEKGTAGYPIDITLTDGSFTYSVEPGADGYFKFTQAGTYVLEFGYNMVYLNGQYLEGDEPRTVAAGDVLKVENYAENAQAINISYAVPTDIVKGNYTYTDNDAEVLVTIAATTVTIGGKDYSVVGVNGNTISLKAEDASTATLTVTGDTLSIDGHELAYKPVFSADQVGTYATSGNRRYTLTLNADGSGSYSTMGTYEITVTDNGDGTYTFSYFYGYYTATFTFNEDGNIVLTDEDMGITDTEFVKNNAPAVAGGTYIGTYTAMDTTQQQIRLTIDLDSMTGTMYLADSTDPYTATIIITKTGDNSYSFVEDTDWFMPYEGTFTVDGNTVTLTILYSDGNENLTLTKQ